MVDRRQPPRSEDITVNVCKKKQLTNMRASGSDEALRLVPPKQMSLEQCLEFLADDELLEVTPKNLRMRKRHSGPREAHEGAARQEVNRPLHGPWPPGGGRGLFVCRPGRRRGLLGKTAPHPQGGDDPGGPEAETLRKTVGPPGGGLGGFCSRRGACPAGMRPPFSFCQRQKENAPRPV